MEGVVTRAPLPAAGFWRGRRVLVTGHTGFKGAWMALWLKQLGAEVHGLALEPSTDPSLFALARVATRLDSDRRTDVRDLPALSDSLAAIAPEIVFHLAAQSLVRRSYLDPAATFATNVMGCVNLLDAISRVPAVRAVVVVTSDKCYDNPGSVHAHRESDPLGGHDPYSASKACAELVASSWRASFVQSVDRPRIATARAGNVIGAGDWALDRLLPDCIRAFMRGESVRLRMPHAVRPWQHVLEPLTGYLLLAERLCGEQGRSYARSWNFGPDASGDATVQHVASEAARLWGGNARVEIDATLRQPHEADVLRLDSAAARAELDWRPRWALATALAATVGGYRAQATGDAAEHVRLQILDYCTGGAATALA